MNTLKRIGIFVLVLIVLLVIISFFLPAKVRVERTTLINAPPAVIYEQVITLKNWPQWAAWFKYDPNMVVTYSGPESGTGSSYSWKGNKSVGEGSLTITDSRPYEYIDMMMVFGGEYESTADMKFENGDAGTKVTWGMNGDMGMNPISKFMGLFMDQMLGGDFEKGLENLKSVSESNSQKATPEINPMPGDTTKTMADTTAKRV